MEPLSIYLSISYKREIERDREKREEEGKKKGFFFEEKPGDVCK
jgi:hypothetical protein